MYANQIYHIRVQLNILAAFYIVDFHVTPERPLMIVLVQYANGGGKSASSGSTCNRAWHVEAASSSCHCGASTLYLCEMHLESHRV